MKRSFYDMLGVAQDADLPHIDRAYGLAMAKLNAANMRGVAAAVNEAQLIRAGYEILSDAKKRAMYNAKLMADQTGVKLMFFPEGPLERRKLGLETAVLMVLITALGGIIYYQMTSKMNEVRIEHVQAVARTKDKQDKAIQVDAMIVGAEDARALPKEKSPNAAERR